MSEVIKIAYRGFGGFILFTFILTFAVTSLALLISGIAVIALSIYVLINPDILQTFSVSFFSGRITDPTTASIIVFFSGILIILLGSGFLALTNIIWNYSLKIDKGLASFFDSKVPKTGVLIDRMKGQPATHTINPVDKISKLERLAKLKEQGILTENEFQQEKQLILKEKD